MKNQESSPKSINKNPVEIKAKLIRLMSQSKSTDHSNDKLVGCLADWSYYRDLKEQHGDNWIGTDDWDVRFLKWAIKGRAKEFVQYCETHPSPESQQALDGIWAIYNKNWPHSATTGYIFGYVWGWLQLELEKPGEKPPMSIEEQKESLIRSCKREGKQIYGFRYDGFGGVFAITDEKLISMS